MLKDSFTKLLENLTWPENTFWAETYFLLTQNRKTQERRLGEIQKFSKRSHSAEEEHWHFFVSQVM